MKGSLSFQWTSFLGLYPAAVHFYDPRPFHFKQCLCQYNCLKMFVGFQCILLRFTPLDNKQTQKGSKISRSLCWHLLKLRDSPP